MRACTRWVRTRIAGAFLVALGLSLSGMRADGQCGLSGVVPNTGPTQGGGEVVFNTSSLVFVGGVLWDGAPAQILSSSPTSVRVRVPQGQGTPAITFQYLTGGSCTAQGVFSYSAPVISQVHPQSVNPGDEVVLTGSNFGLTPSVRVGGVEAELVGPTTHQQIRFLAPQSASGTQSVVVEVGGAVSQPESLNILPPPVIISTIAPVRRTAGGDLIIARGINFGSNTGLLVGDSLATVLESTPTEIIALLPETDGRRQTLRVVRDGAAGPVSALLFPSSPRITGFSPPSIPAGVATELRILGENFGTLNTPVLGGVLVDEVLSVTHTEIVVRTRVLQPGSANVLLLVGGTSTVSGAVEVHEVCSGDTNGDGVVNFADLNAVLSAFGLACDSMWR